MDVSVSETIDQKMYLKKFRGASAPLALPLDPPVAIMSGYIFHPPANSIRERNLNTKALVIYK